VRTDEVIGYLERLIAAWLDAREQAELEDRDLSFRDFCDERTDEQLQTIVTGELETVPA
jgi:hypothetical protein